MDSIELWNGSTKALVDPLGAWLTNLSDDNGDVLFPRRQLQAGDGSKKTRGGCHVCLPNFGPGGESSLPQHGFGRTALWDIVDQSKSTVTVRLVGGATSYEALESVLTYDLGVASIRMTLGLTNTGDMALRIAPAFHPYFVLGNEEGQVQIDEQRHDLDDLAGTLFEGGTEKKIVTQRRTFAVKSTGLSTWALWTDRLGSYVCVEPTFDGNAFVNGQPAAGELLAPGHEATYSMTISW